MAYCPECGAEFGVGVRRCPECSVHLVEELEDPSLYESQEENLVLIKAVTSAEEAKRLKELLENNGILCVVESSSQIKAPVPPSPMNVLVNAKDEPRSQELIKAYLA